MNIYNEWIRLKQSAHENTRRWCRRHGIEEQRLYEISKLRQQFKDVLRESKLLNNKNSEKNNNSNNNSDGNKKYKDVFQVCHYNQKISKKIL